MADETLAFFYKPSQIDRSKLAVVQVPLHKQDLGGALVHNSNRIAVVLEERSLDFVKILRGNTF